MPMTPCCQRREVAVTRAKSDLALFARRMARRPSPKLQAEIDKAKSVVKETERHLIEHEAEHAGE